MTNDICYMSASELAEQIRAKQLSPVEVVEAIFKRIHAVNPKLNAYCTLTEESARAEAKAAEAAVMRGDQLGLLHGVPVSIKDLLITKGVRTMRGSKIYEHFIPDEDAPAVARLKQAGALMLGKTTTPEFGYKGMTDSPVTGVSRNPWNLSRTPGGSSGGAGAAVAAGMGPLAVGTDGGGSIRIPASFCGIFGMKASFGRVAAYPPSAVAALSHTGPMTWTVRDAAMMLNALVGADDRDSNSLPHDGADYLKACEGDIKGLRVAWSANLGYAPIEPEIVRVTEAAAKVFASELGCVLEEANPPFENPMSIFSILWVGGIGTYLQPYLAEWKDKLDQGLARMIELLPQITGEQYVSALMQKAQLWDKTRKFFETYDLLLTPTMPTVAWEAGKDAPSAIAGQPIQDFGYTPFTFPFNLTGQPAATVPCGFSSDGLPIGLQIVGRRLADATVLRACAAFEAARPWHAKRPNV
jgi:aspartyl-tRNA(Asn)/glutamyl-tRNA(Gln) amidotransferase subunit A